MLRHISSPQNLTTQEVRQIITPSLLGIAILCVVVILYAFTEVPDVESRVRAAGLGIFGLVYALAALAWQKKLPPKNPRLKWTLIVINAGISIVALALLPVSMIGFPGAIFMLAVMVKSVLWDRIAAYAYMLLILAGYGLTLWSSLGDAFQLHPATWSIAILTVVVVELIQNMSNVNAKRTRRLQIINDFARQIASTLEQERVLSIVGTAIQEAIEADTYFLGIITNENCIHFLLLYDDNQFFPPAEVTLDGTLSGWVIRNQRPLFIPDLRRDVNLEGIKVILTGNNRDSACWMGVPMKAGSIDGVLAVASYTPNAFDRTALELLENLAQHTALALDNANHHAQVEARARLDSLTEVYNHGYIVQALKNALEKAQANDQPLSLIMLDIDYFKQYNDIYGHQTGDDVLVKLTQAIKQHIKSTDSVGRWGGEEFTIVLPDTNGWQAMQVALRLQETLRTLSLHPKNEKTLPFPTISQGIAVFPAEASDSESLIQLADRRLYIAKQRGRNQVEPGVTHWEKSPPETKTEQ
jgi:diguanylate cyclase (GGDEF)-like protein